MQKMVVYFGARANGDESMLRSPLSWLAASDQVRPWSSHRIFHHVRKECSQHDADSKAQYRDICLV